MKSNHANESLGEHQLEEVTDRLTLLDKPMRGNNHNRGLSSKSDRNT